jgi:hypothetical protein
VSRARPIAGSVIQNPVIRGNCIRDSTLVRRVNGALDVPWDKPTGRPKSLRLYKAVEAACMYLRQNATQEFIGDIRDTSQPTISRYLNALVPLVKSVLEEFVPSAADAIEVVKGRVVPVDGTLTPCWSYEEHQELRRSTLTIAVHTPLTMTHSRLPADFSFSKLHGVLNNAPDRVHFLTSRGACYRLPRLLRFVRLISICAE